MIRAYNFLLFLLLLCAPIWLAYRFLRGKEDIWRFSERFGRAHMPRPDGALIWFHCASVGEVIAIWPLLETLLRDYPRIHILLTSVTVTSAHVVAARKEQGNMTRLIHHYAPYDFPLCARRFLNQWQPDITVFVEQELWPNLIHGVKARQKPLLLINGRMSQNSFMRWQKIKYAAQNLLGHFDVILAQDKISATHFEALGGKQVLISGNLKFDAPALAYDKGDYEEFAHTIGTRQFWLAASTHEGEEDIIIACHKNIKRQYKDLLTIIAPRHPQRGSALCKLIEQAGLSVVQHSQGTPITAQTDIYLVDTIGEMGMFYALSPFCFMGGSLVPHGGQNPLEPARLQNAIIFGPYYSNFTTIFTMLQDAHAARQVKDAAALEMMVHDFFAHPQKVRDLSQAAFNCVQQESGAGDITLNSIANYMGE